MVDQHENNHLDKTRSKKTWGGAIALGLIVALASGCNGVAQNDQVGQDNVTSDDVAQVEPGDSVVGEEVTIRSGVTEVIDDNGFVMESANGGDILVVNSTGTPFTLPQQQIPIQVTGQLETFSAAGLQQRYGVTLDPNRYSQYEQQPVVVANNFAPAPRPQDLWDAPEGYFNETIAVEGDIRLLDETSSGFALFEEGWANDIGVLVIGVDQATNTAELEAGENVVVTGEARQADINLLRQANLNWTDTQIEEFLSRYENRPVIVAEEVYPSATPPHPTV
ncbi:hypothetical protein ACQ4M4_09580 [Leptolyngbya sp. AN02str]|uniref:hypothetical protein n=1 Tax=Leptolyngbya sp. AN02str TaxID=3423363 RepID=UPI003D321CB1